MLNKSIIWLFTLRFELLPHRFFREWRCIFKHSLSRALTQLCSTNGFKLITLYNSVPVLTNSKHNLLLFKVERLWRHDSHPVQLLRESISSHFFLLLCKFCHGSLRANATTSCTALTWLITLHLISNIIFCLCRRIFINLDSHGAGFTALHWWQSFGRRQIPEVHVQVVNHIVDDCQFLIYLQICKPLVNTLRSELFRENVTVADLMNFFHQLRPVHG